MVSGRPGLDPQTAVGARLFLMQSCSALTRVPFGSVVSGRARLDAQLAAGARPFVMQSCLALTRIPLDSIVSSSARLKSRPNKPGIQRHRPDKIIIRFPAVMLAVQAAAAHRIHNICEMVMFDYLRTPRWLPACVGLSTALLWM